MQKKSVLGFLASWGAQNAIGMPIARSKKFRNSLINAASSGALGKKAPRSVKSVAKDAVNGVVAPEVNSSRNAIYDKARDLAKNVGVDKFSKRESAIARLAAAGDTKGLQRIGKQDHPLVKKIRESMDKHSIPNISKEQTKKTMKLQDGYRKPSSTAAAMGANAAISVLPGGASMAAVNATKLATSAKKVQDTSIMRKINSKFLEEPMKKNFDKGRSGRSYDSKSHWRDSVLLNPFTEEANRQSFLSGKKLNKK